MTMRKQKAPTLRLCGIIFLGNSIEWYRHHLRFTEGRVLFLHSRAVKRAGRSATTRLSVQEWCSEMDSRQEFIFRLTECLAVVTCYSPGNVLLWSPSMKRLCFNYDDCDDEKE